MPQIIWKGVVAFGLLHIPVSLYPTTGAPELQLNLLDRRDLSPVGYQRVNKQTGLPVEAGEVVKAYEYEAGKYVVLGDEDLRQANAAAAHTIPLVGFVDLAEIAPYYFDTPFYLEPGKGGEKGYALLRAALRRSGRVGLTRVVIRTRQHLAAVIPVGRALVLNTLRFADEIRAMEQLDFPDENLPRLGVAAGEVELASRLIDVMSESWQPEQYRDTYREDLLARIRQKIDTGRTLVEDEPPPPPPEPPPAAGAGPAEVVDLMAMLRRSLELERSARQAAADKPRRRA